jgi:hypothetical protein
LFTIRVITDKDCYNFTWSTTGHFCSTLGNSFRNFKLNSCLISPFELFGRLFCSTFIWIIFSNKHKMSVTISQFVVFLLIRTNSWINNFLFRSNSYKSNMFTKTELFNSGS